MTNLVCPNCKIENTDYYLEFGFYGCCDCGHSWGGSLEGKDLNRARLEIGWIRFSGTEAEARRAFRIAFDRLDAVSEALENNPTFNQNPRRYVTKLPSDSRWWIENRNDIARQLLALETWSATT